MRKGKERLQEDVYPKVECHTYFSGSQDDEGSHVLWLATLDCLDSQYVERDEKDNDEDDKYDNGLDNVFIDRNTCCQV